MSTPIKGSFLPDLAFLLGVPQPQRTEPLRVIPSSPRGAKGGPPGTGAPGPAGFSRGPAVAVSLRAKTCLDPPLCLTCQGVPEDQGTHREMVHAAEDGVVVDPTLRTLASRVACPPATVDTAQVARPHAPLAQRGGTRSVAECPPLVHGFYSHSWAASWAGFAAEPRHIGVIWALGRRFKA